MAILLGIKPEIFPKLEKQFGVKWDDGIIVAYYPDIYTKFPLHPLRLIHENTHLLQQERMGVEDWWEKYLKDPEFRLSQEVEAYGNEIYASGHEFPIKDRNARARYIHQICIDLSGPMYGKITSYSEAMKLLSKYK